jgi:hypothetical protein
MFRYSLAVIAYITFLRRNVGPIGDQQNTQKLE